MNIDEIYNPYDLARRCCEFIYPSFGKLYEIQWKDTLSPLYIKNENEQDNFFLNPNIKEGSVIFANNHFMNLFFDHLIHINVPFILVSSESDSTSPYMDVSVKTYWTILNL